MLRPDFDTSARIPSYCPNGTIAVEGQTITRPRYAKALALIAKRGPSAFYQGTLANSTISAIQSSGGIMTLEDLEGYQAIERAPVKVKFNGYQLYATSAPSSGAVVLSALQTLNQYDDRETAGYDLITHRLIEATKFGESKMMMRLHCIRPAADHCLRPRDPRLRRAYQLCRPCFRQECDYPTSRVPTGLSCTSEA